MPARQSACLDGHREAARTHYAMGRCDQALSAWEQALRLAPDDADAHFGAAICHWQLAALLRGSGTADGGGAATHLARAATHLETALAAVDGNDDRAAAWARVWGGCIAHERGLNGQSIEALTSALGGPTARAAGLFLTQAGLDAGAVDCVRAAFAGCARVLDPSAGEQLGNDCGASEIAQAPADAGTFGPEALHRESSLLLDAIRARTRHRRSGLGFSPTPPARCRQATAGRLIAPERPPDDRSTAWGTGSGRPRCRRQRVGFAKRARQVVA